VLLKILVKKRELSSIDSLDAFGFLFCWSFLLQRYS